ncbi:hypothetical protein KKB06_03415, partial [Patescibacteria group bacterium]|nr:hypothetical protein [Patescibacteria group bacterium]
MYNTKRKGILYFITFKEKDGDYCAVCLNLNLIEWGKDIDELEESINEAALSYLNGIIKNNLPNELLNKPAPNKYWKMAKKRCEPILKVKPETNKFSFFNLINQPY